MLALIRAEYSGHRVEGEIITAPPQSRVTVSLPGLHTRLIGREIERAAARTFLLDEATHLLTRVGPHGVGKTPLALAVGTDVVGTFYDWMVWVDLTPPADLTMLPVTFAVTLNILSSGECSLKRADIPEEHHLRECRP
jgi:hypothetical protein